MVLLTGKSFLLNRIIDALRQKHGSTFGSCVAVTAATGIAATHIGGAHLLTSEHADGLCPPSACRSVLA